jgi:hypothetical protein
MATAPKAIPTVYDGERYDSQLEARGAAFFDMHPLVSAWRPKPGTFNFGDEEYTPDFIITILGVEIIVEVKPSDPSTAHRAKLMRVAEYTQREVVYLIGSWFKDEIPYIRSSNDVFEKVISLHRHVIDLNQVHKSKRILSDDEYEKVLAQWQLFSRKIKK